MNAMRGYLATLGLRFPKGTAKLVVLVEEALAERPDLKLMIEPLIASVETLDLQIKCLDRAVEVQAEASPAAPLLETITSVGSVTALAYAATMEDAGRFASSRAVRAYLGLTPRRNQSGEMDYNGRISKFGDGMLRALLYSTANNLLTVSRKSHPLKDWARRIRSGHMKAWVALARKLAVSMQRMLITGEAFRWPAERKEEAV